MTLFRRLILALALIAGLTPAMAQVPAPVPALPDSERRTSYSISGSTCICAVNMALYGDSTDYQNWVEVWINGVRYDYNDASHGWTITSPSGSLSTLARPITNAVLTFSAVQTGTVQIVGARRPRRTAQFAENAPVPARNLNQAFTDIIATQREVWDKTNDMTGRGFFAPPGQTGATITGALTGIISGPSSVGNGNLAIWNGTSGAALADGGPIPSINVTAPPYNAKCDGATDDTAAINSAVLASHKKILSFPAGKTCVAQYLEICSNPTCLTGHAGTGGSVPYAVRGNGVTLKASAAASGQATFVYVEQQTATNIPNFVMQDVTIDANGANRGLTVFGCEFCSFVNINEKQALVAGCHFSSAVGYVFSNNVIGPMQCNTNNTNSGVSGIGVFENTSATWLGATDCSANPQNAGNTFTNVSALFNGLIGWDVDCADNHHINADMERNLSYGLTLTHVVNSTWDNPNFSANHNARGSPGTGGDASAINNDASTGILFFGGASDGTLTGLPGIVCSPGCVVAGLTFGAHLTSGGSSYNTTAPITITSDATAANTASTIMARDGSGQVAATTFTGALAGTATNATNIAITDDTTTNATVYPTWVTANTGNVPEKVTSTKLVFNPSTGVLFATGFNGAGTALTGTAASLTAGAATNTTITDDTTSNISANVTWVTSNSGNLPQKTTSTKLVFNPSTGVLFSTAFNGSGAALTSIPTTALTGALQAAQEPAHTGDVTNTAGSLGLSLVAGNAGNLNSGTLLAARMPALTGDCTTSAGAVATTCTKINSVDQTTAWSSSVPSITCTAGSPTNTSTVRTKILGKSMFWEFNVNITAASTCTGNITIPGPGSVFQANAGGVAIDNTTAGLIPVLVSSGASSFVMSNAGAPAAHIYTAAGVVEIQ